MVSISTIITLLLCEQGYRFHLFGWDSFSIARMDSIRPMGRAGLTEASEYPEVVYQLKPNLDTYFKLKSVRTTAEGLRDIDYPRDRIPGVSRICVVGDSYTMPAGVDIENAFHSVLEDRLNASGIKRSGDTGNDSGNLDGTRKVLPGGCEVINFAVGGYTLRQYLGVIEHRIDAWSPDLILVGFCPYNDHVEPPERIFHQPYTPKPVVHTFFHSYLWSRLTGKRRLDAASFFTPSQTEYMTRIFRGMHTYSIEHRVPIIVLLLSYDTDPVYSGNLKKLVTGAGLDYLDLSPGFDPSNRRQYWIYPIDGHPNDDAHRIFADEIYRYLITGIRPGDATGVASSEGNEDRNASLPN